MKTKEKWIIVDEYNLDKIIRGPYRYIETAAAVRTELQDRWPNRCWNLCVVKLPDKK